MPRVLAAALVALVLAAPAAHACKAWAQPVSGSFHAASSWADGVAPLPGDVVCIDLPGSYTVFSSQPINVERITFGNGSPGPVFNHIAGDLTVPGGITIGTGAIFQWVNGYLRAGTLLNQSIVLLLPVAGNGRGLGGATAVLDNRGVVAQATNFWIHAGGRVENRGVWDLQGDGVLGGSPGGQGGPGTFVNHAGATFGKSGGDSEVVLQNAPLTFENAGLIDVRSGTLRFTRPSRHVGATFAVADSAALHFDAGEVTFAGPQVGLVVGRLELSDDFRADSVAAFAFLGQGLEWTAGSLRDGTVVNTGTVRFTGPADSFRGLASTAAETAIFRNVGFVRHETDGTFNIVAGDRVENAASWRISGDGDIGTVFGGTQGPFVNESGALLIKDGGTGTSQMFASAGFQNDGTIDVRTGTLEVFSASSHTDATLDVAAGATLRFGPGAITFAGTTTGSGAGALVVTGAITATGDARWDIDGQGVEWSTGQLVAGTLRNTGHVRLTGTVNTRGACGAGTVAFRNEGTVDQNTGAFTVCDGDRAENAGTWTLTGDVGLRGSGPASPSAVFVNEAGAVLRKDGGTGTSTVTGAPLVVQNAGRIAVLTGTLRFDRPSSHTGGALLDVALSATLHFDVGAVTFAGAVGGAVPGTLTVSDAVTLGADARWSFNGTGVEWRDSQVTAGTLVNAGHVRFTGGTANVRLFGTGVVFRNEGTVEHAGASILSLYDGARVENAGTWSVTADGDLRGSSSSPGAASTFVNEAGGLFVKTGGTGVSDLSTAPLTFDNHGTVRVDTGRLDVNRPFIHRPGAVVAGRGQFDVAGASLTHDGRTSPGGGPGGATGTLSWTGAWAPAATGLLAADLAGDADHDRLAVSTAATLGGTLSVRFAGGYDPAVGRSFTLVTCGTACTGTFATVALPAGVEGDVVVLPTSVVLTITALAPALVRAEATADQTFGHEGGRVPGVYEVVERAGAPWATQTWATLALPDRRPVPVDAARPLALSSGETEAVEHLVVLFDGAPAGVYVYARYVGTPGVDTLAVDTLVVSKLAGRRVGSEATTGLPDGTAVVGVDGEVRIVGSALAGAGRPDLAEVPAEASAEALPAETTLRAPYPNPAAGLATVRFDLAERARARLTVYDVLGREVAVVADGERPAGRYAEPLRALPAGVYVVRLDADARSFVQRLTVTR